MKPFGTAFIWVSLAVMGATVTAQAAQTCDRQCLVTMMQNYLAALVKHDPSAVPFADEVKFTENTANIPVGYGLWVTASGAGCLSCGHEGKRAPGRAVGSSSSTAAGQNR